MSPPWQKLPTPDLLEHAYELTRSEPNGQAAECICALVWRLRALEEWIASQAKRQHTIPHEALRAYGKQLGVLTRQFPFNTIDMGSGIRGDAADVAASFFNALLEVLCEMGLLAPGARAPLSDWLLDEAL